MRLQVAPVRNRDVSSSTASALLLLHYVILLSAGANRVKMKSVERKTSRELGVTFSIGTPEPLKINLPMPLLLHQTLTTPENCRPFEETFQP